MEKTLWAIKEGREQLLKKIDSLKLALPAVSYFQNRDSLYDGYNMSHVMFFYIIVISSNKLMLCERVYWDSVSFFREFLRLCCSTLRIVIIFQIFLHNNYFNNSMILLKRYRALMYTELKGQVDDPKQM